MKQKLGAKIQRLRRQAGQWRQAVEAAPAQAARLREKVVLTVGQLHQLRSELLTGITELRADSGEHLLKVLGEVRESTEVLGEAGFELAGVDLELGLNAGQRLLLQLRAVDPAEPATIDRLARANAARPALRGVLAALQRAVEFAGTVDIPDLELSQLTVAVGPIPTIRIGWREVLEVEESDSNPATQPPPVLSPIPVEPAASIPPEFVAPSVPPPAATPAGSARPSVGPAPEKTAAPAPLPPSASPIATVEPIPAPAPMPTPTPTPTPALSTLSSSKRLGSDWRTGALDRFKKMPDLHPGS